MERGYEFDQKIRRELKKNLADLPGLQFSSDLNPSTVSIAGVDEVGRGPLAGPVVAAAVILPEDPQIVGLNDSKRLSEKKRESLCDQIQKIAISYSISVIENETVDSINILAASLQAMRNAIADLKVCPHLILVDGNQKPRTGSPERAIVKGDSLSASIMAASIVAKVTRDRMMVDAHNIYPQYGFNGHKGYGSSQHMEALRKYGPCPLHRKSFAPVRELLNTGKKFFETAD